MPQKANLRATFHFRFAVIASSPLNEFELSLALNHRMNGTSVKNKQGSNGPLNYFSYT